jgi:hypothetical protein
MKPLALALLLLVPPAQAQMYKCVDERGKTIYADKPIPNCKGGKTVAPPPSSPAASAKSSARTAKGQPSVTPEQAEYDRKYAATRCKTMKEEEDWLLSPRGASVPSREARLGQVRQALAAGCR